MTKARDIAFVDKVSTFFRSSGEFFFTISAVHCQPQMTRVMIIKLTTDIISNVWKLAWRNWDSDTPVVGGAVSCERNRKI